MQASPPPAPSNPADDASRLAALERRWKLEFEQQPKLPSGALLTGAVSMAAAFGFVLFLLSHWMRSYAWIWILLSLGFGAANRMLAARWYRDEVIPWDLDRRTTHQEIQELKAKLAGGLTADGSGGRGKGSE